MNSHSNIYPQDYEVIKWRNCTIWSKPFEKSHLHAIDSKPAFAPDIDFPISIECDTKIITMIANAVEISIITNNQSDDACIRFDSWPSMYLNRHNVAHLLAHILGVSSFALKKLSVASQRVSGSATTIISTKTFTENISDILAILISKSQVENIYLEPTAHNANKVIQTIIGLNLVDEFYICPHSSPKCCSNACTKMKITSLVFNIDIDANGYGRIACWDTFFDHMATCEHLKSFRIVSADYNLGSIMKILNINSITTLFLNLHESWNQNITYVDFMTILRKIAAHPHLEYVRINYVPTFSCELELGDSWVIDENIIYDIFEHNVTLQKIEFTPFSDKYPSAFDTICKSNIKSARKN